MKLTPPQQKLLDELKATKSFLNFMPYKGRFNPNAYYFMSGSLKHVRYLVATNLLKKGYLVLKPEKCYRASGDHTLHLKENYEPQK